MFKYVVELSQHISFLKSQPHDVTHDKPDQRTHQATYKKINRNAVYFRYNT